MRKRLFVLLLTAVMLIASLGITVSAGTIKSPTLGELIKTVQDKGGNELYLPWSIAVNEETTIPAGFTVVVPDGVVIDINKTLNVKGNLFINGSMTLGSNKNINGHFSYTGLSVKENAYGLDTYQWQYAYNYYLRYGFYPSWYVPTGSVWTNPWGTTTEHCSKHGCNISYCSTCGTWHCPKCGHTYAPSYTPSYSPEYHYCMKHKSLMSYCAVCGEYYCTGCTGSHTHAASSYYYCPTHGCYKTYCSDCNAYICAKCGHGYTPVHNYTSVKYYSPIPGSYIFYPGMGYIYYAATPVTAPASSIASGAKVKFGTTVSLASTSGANIYYTTNGTLPTANSTLYTGPITITKDVTIRAMAEYRGITSEVATFKYSLITAATFTDTAKYDGLDEALETLIVAGVIEDGKTFNPTGTVSYANLADMLDKMGCDISKVDFDLSSFEGKEVLTYDDLVYLTYRTLRAYDMINPPKTSGSVTIKQLSHYKEVPNASIYRAAYVSFLENDMFYDINIVPSANATRVDLAVALAGALNAK